MDVAAYLKEKGPARLIVCDIDNTLVVKHHMLTKRAKAVIQRLQRAGILFGIASGRSLQEVQRIVKRWGFEQLDVLICMNGSVLWDGIRKEKSCYHRLSGQAIKEIMDLMSGFDHNPIIYREDRMLCKRIDEMVSCSAHSAQMEAVKVPCDEVFYQEDNEKIMFRVHACDMEQIEAYLAAHPSSAYHAFKTQDTLIEFSHRMVSKAYALKVFCERHTLPVEAVMAFGDTSNDNTMLQISGMGVCMCNGSSDTLAIADSITEKSCDEDGWADYMEHYMDLAGEGL